MALQSLEGLSIALVVKIAFAASNNEFEYEAVFLRLRLTKELRCNLQFVAPQLRGEYEDKNRRIEQYLKLAQSLMVGFKKFIVAQVPREENRMADALANLASSSLYPYHMELSIMDHPSIYNAAILTVES